jgi:predicted kinase
MATLFMLCGLPGSGKTTLARQLELGGALALILDDWVALKSGANYDEKLGEEIDELQLQIALDTLQLGRDVVLDWGFDSREERDRVRAQAVAIGANTRLLFLDVPRSELDRRIAGRTWPVVSKKSLDDWTTAFERPQPDESPERITFGSSF